MSFPDAADEEVFTAPPAAPQAGGIHPSQPASTSDTATLVPVPPSQPHPPTTRPVEWHLTASPAAPNGGRTTQQQEADTALVERVYAVAAAIEEKAEEGHVVSSPPKEEKSNASSSSGAGQTTVQAAEVAAAPSAVTSAVDSEAATHEARDGASSPPAFVEAQQGGGEEAVRSDPAPPAGGVADGLHTPEPAAQGASPAAAAAAAVSAGAEAWVVDFGTGGSKPKRKMTKKEKDAMRESRLRSQQRPPTTAAPSSGATENSEAAAAGLGADSEGNAVHTRDAALQHVQLDGLADRGTLIPTELTTTRRDLEQRLVLRLPRLLCVNKQYPRGCGIASLTSVYNYLYSWLGESEVSANTPPHSQEEMMSVLGFEPPFGEIAWGPFTGNVTLIRWFHALNRHFGHRGRAYILYKAQGQGKTTHLYPDNAAALVAVKAALRDPHCALIYHCHNHYMVPVGYQEIPQAQTDFLKPTVPLTSTDTTIFIGEVSRGRHEAMYARKWEQVVTDLECQSPFFYNIRHPELGVQRREGKKKAAAAAVEGEGAVQPAVAGENTTQEGDATTAAVDGAAADVTPAPMNAPEDARDSNQSVPTPAATAAVEVVDAQGDAEPAEPPASPVTNADDMRPLPSPTSLLPSAEVESATTTTTATPPPPMSESVAASASAAVITTRRAVRPPLTRRPARPPTQQPPAAKAKREPNNLHCLILFRNDQAEEHLGRYEDDAEDSEVAATRASSASSSSDGSSSSDEDAR